jgi:hypothetical protein
MQSKPPTAPEAHPAPERDRVAVSVASQADHASYLRDLAVAGLRGSPELLLLDASYAIEGGSPPLVVVDRVLEVDDLPAHYRARLLELRAELVAQEG